jgi:hypothetical protein
MTRVGKATRIRTGQFDQEIQKALTEKPLALRSA